FTRKGARQSYSGVSDSAQQNGFAHSPNRQEIKMKKKKYSGAFLEFANANSGFARSMRRAVAVVLSLSVVLSPSLAAATAAPIASAVANKVSSRYSRNARYISVGKANNSSVANTGCQLGTGRGTVDHV